MIDLRSDNVAPVAPRLLEAISAANEGTALAYGGDDVTAELQEVVRVTFEHPTARVFPVTSGTAMNALALSAMTPPWGAVWCHETAHIQVNEANATSMFAGGAALRSVPGGDALVDVAALRDGLASVNWGDNHQSQPTVLSLTQPTDRGTVYPLGHVRELVDVATEHGMRVHIDGARLANAIVALDCSPADITWRSGASAVSVGATKNGAMSAEAIVVFDDSIADELVFRTKRAGHVTSKMRFQSAQLIAYFRDGYWLELAENANRRMSDLISMIGCLDGVKLIDRVDANMAFIEVTDEIAGELEAAGLAFYRMGRAIRLVTNWTTTADDVDRTVAAFTAAQEPT